MNRLNQILGVILVAQVALAAFILWPHPVAEANGGPLLGEFSTADVIALNISDNEGHRLGLGRNGETWVLDQADEFPANVDKITPVLEKLKNIQANRLVTQTEASHKRLNVAPDDFNRLVEITLADGSKHRLYLGSSAGAGATHVRLADRTEVYLAGDVNSYDFTPRASGWIDTQYYTLPQTATVSLALKNDNGTFVFIKNDDTWTLEDLAEGETLKESAVTTLLNQAAGVRMVEPIGKKEQPSFGLDQPQAIVTLTTQTDDQTQVHTLRIGAINDDDNSYVAAYSDSPYYVRVSQYTGETFVNKIRDDFLEPPPTAEPAPPTPAAGN